MVVPFLMAEALPFGGETFKKVMTKGYNNDFDNTGKSNSFVYYGDLWAQAATAPNYMYKMWATEGEINCPFIFYAPKLTKKLDKNQIIDQFITVMDILHTILELAEIPHPGTSFQGRQVYKPKGLSWRPFLNKESEKIYDDTIVTG